jgi:hypothetical protein
MIPGKGGYIKSNMALYGGSTWKYVHYFGNISPGNAIIYLIYYGSHPLGPCDRTAERKINEPQKIADK